MTTRSRTRRTSKSAGRRTVSVGGRMKLGAVKRSLYYAPDRILLYGIEGVGKTSFGAAAPKPIFIAPEKGTATVDVDRFPTPRTWEEAMEGIEELIRSEHDYKTIVIDSLTWLETLLYDRIKADNNWTDKTADEYNRWLKFSVGYWMTMFRRLEVLESQGMNVILIAHAKAKKFTNPDGDDYDRYRPDLGGNVGPELFVRWADTVAFCHFQTIVKRDTDNRYAKAKARSTGRRVMCVEHSASYDAKNKSNLPSTLPLSYEEYRAARLDGEGALEEMVAEARELFNRVEDPEERARIGAYIKKNKGDLARMSEALNRLRIIVDEQYQYDEEQGD